MRLWIIAGLVSVTACARGGPAEAPPGGFGLGAEPPLTELAWIAPGADKVRLLTESPGECLRAPADDATGDLVETGRAAFNSPLLFGGQAARGGLACSSCHRSGHDNPAFFIAGLSGAPGTADVTSSLFSKVREDGVFDPVPIPSLVGITDKEAFGTRAPATRLHDFIASAVADEFQGAPPPDTVLRGLEAYVAHLDPDACADKAEPRTVQRDMADISRALDAASAAIGRGDISTADFLLVSAQNALGRVHERYAAPVLAAERKALESLAAELAAVRPVLPDDAAKAAARIGEAQETAISLTDSLHDHRHLSLYDVATLAAALRE